jgi:hypothetical protein
VKKLTRLGMMFLVLLVIFQAVACSQLDEVPIIISPSSIDVEYPDGMKVVNGNILQINLVNKTLYCLEFPVKDTIPIFVYVGSGELPVQNDMIYQITSIKMSPLNTTAARRRFGVMPYINIHDEQYTLPIYRAYIPLEGHICGDPTVTVTKEIPFFIQLYDDY